MRISRQAGEPHRDGGAQTLVTSIVSCNSRHNVGEVSRVTSPSGLGHDPHPGRADLCAFSRRGGEPMRWQLAKKFIPRSLGMAITRTKSPRLLAC